ncbi:MAG: universal stress protein [Chloroflexi bacterium]|nr:universal stress protein [Chloroflexota bacterium]MBI4267425.1 universal stress protein [Chloroflexota bacterium]
MFEKILVPLDGSELAEIAIPYAEEIGGRLGSEITLLHVCRPEHEAFQHMHKIYLANIVDSVERYIRRHWPKSGTTVKGEALPGEPDQVIGGHIKENNIGLLVMASHGASGLRTLVIGSVADKVVRSVWVPTLIIRAKAAPQEGKAKLINRILLPLDGSDASKMALAYAEELAIKVKASIHLFRMARSSYAYAGLEGVGGTVTLDLTRIDRAEEKRVRDYLAGIAEEIRARDIPVTYSTMLGTDPAYELIELSDKVDADLIVMSTRGRSPLARWIIGSTAEKLLREGKLPLLLVRQVKG